MSGLLPRTPSGGQTGDFANLNVQTLTVSVSGFINALTANEMSVGDLDVAAITTGTINGDPNLNIVATTASVGGDTIVTRTATQTLTNKTLTAPIISTISNTGTLTLPTSTDTLVGRATTDTLTNKTLTSPIISTITNTGTLTLPTTTTTLVGRNTTDTLSNKTIDSALNTITITSSPLSGQDINNVLNQAVRTGSAVTFGTVTTQSLLLSTSVNDAITVRSTTGQNNQILFQNTGPVDQTAFGYDVLNSLHRAWGYLNSPFVFATNNLERMRIPAGGIANDNTITNILGLSGTTLAYKNNVVDLSTAQVLTNKTLTAPIISTISNTGTLTLPTSTDTLVGRATTDTLTNKTLTAPVIATISNTGTLTLPTATDTLVGRATTDSLSNKTLATGTCVFSDGLTRTIQFNPSGTSSTTLELRRALSANRTQEFIDADGNIVLDTATQTLTNKDFSGGLTEFVGKDKTWSGTRTTTGATTETLVTIPTTTDTAMNVYVSLMAFCTAGASANTTSGQRLSVKVQNVAGAVTTAIINNVFSNAFVTGLGVAASGTDAVVQITGIAANTINWRVYVEAHNM